ncbi:MAG: DUF2997 domain-containing protein [Deltaproteobacteria bacterium]|nr:DUF2997 domain-containing protein [Candidatus Tharpella sp.]
MSKIKVKIYEDGRVDLSLSDFNNGSCLDTTRTVERLLGNEIINRRFLSTRLSETITAKEKSLAHSE